MVYMYIHIYIYIYVNIHIYIDTYMYDIIYMLFESNVYSCMQIRQGCAIDNVTEKRSA